MITHLDNFTRQSIAQREEISILGATLNDLAKEKECLQACLDKKSENIASLGESLAMKVCSENCDLKERYYSLCILFYFSKGPHNKQPALNN